MADVYPRSIFATLPFTTRGMPIVLGGDPKGKNFLYTNRNSVIIRDINNAAIADVYTQHSVKTTVAKYAPSGYYIASADVSGKVRIWDTTQREHILKYEYQPFSGPVKDLAWSPDSKRIVVGGEGRDRFCHVFMWDTGTSVGNIYGHSKAVNSVDYRPDRPFRIVTASEDYTVGWFQGPPFKFSNMIKDHTNFVNCTRFHPSGNLFMTGGADGKVFVYDGKTGDRVGDLGSPAHKAGVYAISFSADGQQLLSVSADKTAKIWDTTTLQLVTEFPMGKEIEDMQVGCLWQNEHLLTVSLSGYINYLDINNPNTPLRIIKGHNKPISALAYSRESNKFYTGSVDSRICQWDAETGENAVVGGKGHLNMIQDMVVKDGTIVSVSVDDTLRFTKESTLEYGINTTKLDSQPRAVAHTTHGNRTIVACINQLVLFENERKVFALQTPYEPTSVDIHPSSIQVAVGGKDKSVYLYTLDGNTISFTDKKITHLDAITDVKFSPNGEYVVVADTIRRSIIYDTTKFEPVGREGLTHNARLNCLAWSPSSHAYCLGSLDASISVWMPPKNENIYINRAAHAQSSVSRVCWLDDRTVVSAADDCNLKIWAV